jgi:hypothetical protein
MFIEIGCGTKTSRKTKAAWGCHAGARDVPARSIIPSAHGVGQIGALLPNRSRREPGRLALRRPDPKLFLLSGVLDMVKSCGEQGLAILEFRFSIFDWKNEIQLNVAGDGNALSSFWWRAVCSGPA